MDQALFESITGYFIDGTSIEDIPPKERLQKSVMDNLIRMFNTRCGSISHMKDYGLPDISEIYRQMPDGIKVLKKAIITTIEKYEPRLKNITVSSSEKGDDTIDDNSMEKDAEKDKKSSQITFYLSAEYKKGGTARFQTTFMTTGKPVISPWKGSSN